MGRRLRRRLSRLIPSVPQHSWVRMGKNKTEITNYYPGDTLHKLVICLQLYFDTMNKPYKFHQQQEFLQIKNTLDGLIIRINHTKLNMGQCWLPGDLDEYRHLRTRLYFRTTYVSCTIWSSQGHNTLYKRDLDSPDVQLWLLSDYNIYTQICIPVSSVFLKMIRAYWSKRRVVTSMQFFSELIRPTTQFENFTWCHRKQSLLKGFPLSENSNVLSNL